MPYMNVIPPGLDFSNLKVDLPEDPAIKEMLKAKYGFGAQLASPHATREGQDPLSPTSDASESGAFCALVGCDVTFSLISSSIGF